MKKAEKEYQEQYGNIPRGTVERFTYLLDHLKMSKKVKKMLMEKIHHNLDIKWNSVDFTIYLVPKATPRPRHNFKTHVFYVTGAKDNHEIFKKFMTGCDLPLISTPCKFFCTSYFPTPESMPNADKLLAEMGLIRPISKPDWDNVGKAYSDMIQGTLLFDDSLIVEGISKKFYSVKPRIEIHIEYMEEHDCKYNENKLRKKV